MRRREFIAGLGGAAAWPLAARAQQLGVRKIAMLSGGAETDPEQTVRFAAFQQALRTAGWVEGRNISIDIRYADGQTARIDSFAREMVDARPDVLVASTSPVVAAFRRLTSAIPIVFVVVSDPVGSGFVADLARPGGNITGFINIESSLSGKWVELLKEAVPRLNRVGMMFNPDTAPQANYYLAPFEAAARSLAIESIAISVRSEAEIEQSIAALGREPDAGLVVMSDVFVSVHRKLIITHAGRFHLPVVYPFRFFVKEGGLISYGVHLLDSYTRAASYVDRILKGEKPADLPVQVPTKFELAINLETANALGITLPPMLLGRADEVIE
jgi:putative ABC transport system substrate-binding protein